MVRTQIQLPNNLHLEVRRVARQQEWSVAEVIRRGAEAVVRAYPAVKSARSNWSLPAPIRSRLLVTDASGLRDAIRADEEPRA